MTDNLRRSISLGNGSSQNMPQGIAEAHDQVAAEAASRPAQAPDLALEIQALQILDSSDDCIKVLDLEGRILFMNRGGQALLNIQDITPFLHTCWIEFWQGEDRQAASEAIAKARTGEVCTFQGYCPALSGEPKWWDSKVSPMRGADGQVERLLCISRDITERRRIEGERNQAEEQSRESDERYRAIINQAVAGVACTGLNGKLTLVNQKYCDITGYSADELIQLRMQDITHPEDLPRNVELFHRMRTEGTPFEIEKRYVRKDGSIVWVNNSVYVIRDHDGKPQSAVAIALDITERKQAEAALQASEAQFRLFTAASSDTVYKMSADWREMRLLEGKDFLASTQHPSQTWLEKYIPPEEQSRVMAAIAEAIRTKSTFELEHRVIQLNGTIGWTFSRAIPLLNDQNEIVEWLGAASDVTAHKQAELSAEFLATATQNLMEATCVEDIIQTIGEQLNRYLQVSICAFVEIDESAWVATIDHCWHQKDGPNLVGVYRLSEFVTGEFFQATKNRQTIIVRDVKTDSRIANPKQFAALKIGSFINVPLIRDNEWKFTLGIYHQTPYDWRNDEIALMRELANRIWTKLERTRVETALRESEAKYRSLFNSIDEGYFLADVIFDENDQPIDVYYLEANPAAERIVGRNFTGRRLKEVEPNYEGYWYEIPGRVARTGKSEHLEHYAEPDQKWYELSVFKVGDESSRRVAVLFNDITDRKRHEANTAFLAEIADNFSRLSTADEIMQITCTKTVAHFDLSRCLLVKISEAKNQAEVVYDFSADDLPSLVGTYSIADFHTKDEVQELANGRAIVINDTAALPRTPEAADRFAQLQIGALVNAPYVSDGQWKFVLGAMQAQPHLWRSDEIEVLQELSARVCLGIDRADAEAALRESEARLQRSLAIETVGVIFFKAEGGITDCNDAFLRMSGYSRADFEQGRVRWDTLTPPEWMAASRRAIEEFLTLGRSTPYEKEYIRKDGSRWWGLFAASRLSETEGVEFIIDVSERKRIEDERKRAEAEREQLLVNEQQARAAAEASREEAQAANRVKDEFLAVLSHELRSPLNPILGWTRLLQNGKLDQTRQREALATIERNAKLQTQLIEDLLDISRIMQGKLSLTVAPVSLTFVITAAVETVRLAAEAKQIQILLDLTTATVPVSGDAARLQQVVWNLLTNAVKFTPNGGRVTVELRQLDQLAQIRVTDTGKGISADFLPYVFEYFRQADSTTTRKFGGLGLGLAIVRQIVEMHGGTVWVESEGENRGAIFTVQLPLSPQASSREVEPPSNGATTGSPLSNLHILLVDDETDTREFQAFVLEQSGARVTVVASGFEALQVLDRFIPDVLVSDVGMAEMDGYMLMQQIRSRPRDRGGMIPAIALTAYVRDFDQQKALQAGFQSHLSKPVEPEALVQAIVCLYERTRGSVG